MRQAGCPMTMPLANRRSSNALRHRLGLHLHRSRCKILPAQSAAQGVKQIGTDRGLQGAVRKRTCSRTTHLLGAAMPNPFSSLRCGNDQTTVLGSRYLACRIGNAIGGGTRRAGKRPARRSSEARRNGRGADPQWRRGDECYRLYAWRNRPPPSAGALSRLSRQLAESRSGTGGTPCWLCRSDAALPR